MRLDRIAARQPGWTKNFIATTHLKTAHKSIDHDSHFAAGFFVRRLSGCTHLVTLVTKLSRFQDSDCV